MKKIFLLFSIALVAFYAVEAKDTVTLFDRYQFVMKEVKQDSKATLFAKYKGKIASQKLFDKYKELMDKK